VDASAERFQNQAGYAARVLDGTGLPMPAPKPPGIKASEVAMGLTSTLLAVALAWATLFRKPLATRAVRPYIRALQTGVGAIRQVHNGIIADQVTWLTVGLAAFGALAAALLRPL